jgi:hypothetical protein
MMRSCEARRLSLQLACFYGLPSVIVRKYFHFLREYSEGIELLRELPVRTPILQLIHRPVILKYVSQ